MAQTSDSNRDVLSRIRPDGPGGAQIIPGQTPKGRCGERPSFDLPTPRILTWALAQKNGLGVNPNPEEGIRLLAAIAPAVEARLAVELVRRDVEVAVGRDR